jgi:hypothetical protein
MVRLGRLACWLGVCAVIVTAGCQSPYYADRGALAGGLGGAGAGALIGSASGHAGAGALIGAGVGAVSGALVGGGLDEIEAKNRAQIAAQMGRQLPPGGVQINDVLAMSNAGVQEELIVNHIRANGMMQPLQAGDLIALQQQSVSPAIVTAMQTSPPRMAAAPPMAVPVAPPPVYYYPPPPPVYYRPPSVGFSYYSR